METEASVRGAARRLTLRQWAQLVVVHLLVPAVLLVCGRDFGWWQAWVFSVEIVAAGLLGRVLAERKHPGLLAERAKFGRAPGAKPWDKALAPLMAVSLSFPPVIVAGLDHRFGWSPEFWPGLDVVGLALVALGYAFAAWAMVTNRFFSAVVSIQRDKGHAVCDGGPYRIVRHPGYAGNLLALPAMALALGSAWMLVPAAAALAVSVVRTALEDRTLREELPGYAEYARRVRFRLFPGIY